MASVKAAPAAHAATQASSAGNGNGHQGPTIVDPNINAVMNQFGGLNISTPHTISGMVPYATPDGRIVFASSYPTAGVPAFGYGAAPDGPSASFGNAYLPQGNFQPLMSHYPVVPYTPAGRSGAIHEHSEAGSGAIPALDNRRSSYSTSESTPATPFFGSMASRDHGTRVAMLDRSTFTTPSPQQIVAASGVRESKSPLLDRHPSIPFAVPAIFTPRKNMKTLEQSLVNPIPGNRNVYIRGLHPTTDDELLLKYAERFGKVETSKAIIDAATGACKGFGFAKFCNVRDSEACIRAFYSRGYEVGFARESFNSRLRAEGDESSTNLYLSNLPKSYTEAEIATIFEGYTILSSKVLRDSLGNSRGVGFARFENRETCEDVIQEFVGRLIGHERLPLQIRFADTPRQKELKRVTAERRQWRTNEYNASAYGTPLVGMNPHNELAYRNGNGGNLGTASQRTTSGGSSKSGTRPNPLEDGPSSEGVEIGVGSPLVAHGSSQSSPAKHNRE
ncbi:hypothetical protein GGS23DRAFT_602243 [Durotheca rogersii]|uniref:uncharacterized protein n=1 Tax=Durotheca rogersii TaxID=419775 RepID=UPI0022211DAE|nr:uncharacterized protein GGS23DRAFT_602243 [Durotheca rogersii]KAI5868465.1 hypothetical protein GGS23DRAFT_602243 [Durotheca rogersii]